MHKYKTTAEQKLVLRQKGHKVPVGPEMQLQSSKIVKWVKPTDGKSTNEFNIYNMIILCNRYK